MTRCSDGHTSSPRKPLDQRPTRESNPSRLSVTNDRFVMPARSPLSPTPGISLHRDQIVDLAVLRFRTTSRHQRVRYAQKARPSRGGPSCLGIKLPLMAAAGPLLNQRKRSFNTQRSAHLAWRIFFERLKKLSNNRHAGHHCPQFVTPPTGIHHQFVLVTLPWIFRCTGAIFILSEISRVIGEDNLWSLFFRRRNL